MSRLLNILITGSSRGIGKAIAIELAKDGHNIVINNHLHADEVEHTFEEIRPYSPNSIWFIADVSNYKQVDQMKLFIKKHLGNIDVLVNNAGITQDRTINKLNVSDWERVMSTNLKGVFNCTKVFLPEMIEKKCGRIINISSVVGFLGNYGQSNYAASKAGVVAFTKSVAQEVAEYGITVNAIAPGFIKTKMVQKIPKEILQKIIDRIPLKRLGYPEEVAHVVKFLMNENSQYITGQTIHINGGLYM